MNNKEWDNFKNILTTKKHICINIIQFTDLLMIPFNAKSILNYDPVTDKDILKLGFYGTFITGSRCYVSKFIPPSCISVFLGEEFPENNADSNWSSTVPIELLDSEETLERLLKLKAFW